MRYCILLALPLLLLSACSRWAYKVPTAAMEPTIRQGDTVWVDHRYYLNHPVQRFDIVLYEASNEGDPNQGKGTKIVKRVIGLGGEKVELKNGKVLINDSEIDQPFAFRASQSSFGPINVPANEYFVLGDNRDNS